MFNILFLLIDYFLRQGPVSSLFVALICQLTQKAARGSLDVWFFAIVPVSTVSYLASIVHLVALTQLGIR
jgi:hypothetical protein